MSFLEIILQHSAISRRLTYRQHFCVGERVAIGFAKVAATADNPAVGVKHNGTHRHLARFCSFSR